MKLRLLAIAQVAFGGVLLLIGGVVSLTYGGAADEIASGLGQCIRGVAEQLDATADSLHGQQVIFDDADRTAASYEELLQAVKASSEELGKNRESWTQVSNDVREIATSAGDQIKAFGDAIDFPIPTGVSPTWGKRGFISYPNGIEVAWSDALQRRAAAMRETGERVKRTGQTIGTTVAAAASEYGRTQAAFAKAVDSSTSLVGDMRNSIRSANKRDLPRLVSEMRASNQRLISLSERVRLMGPLCFGLGLLAVGGALICFLNGLALLSIDKALRRSARPQSRSRVNAG